MKVKISHVRLFFIDTKIISVDKLWHINRDGIRTWTIDGAKSKPKNQTTTQNNDCGHSAACMLCRKEPSAYMIESSTKIGHSTLVRA